MNDHRFVAMGCGVLVGGGTWAERTAIQRLFAEREVVFSRFLPRSELNLVNASAGRVIMVSPLFARTLRVALEAAEETEGLVRPTLGGALEAAGYTRDSSVLAPDPTPRAPSPRSGSVFALGRFVGLDTGVTLDLNGVVKALAVDDAIALIAKRWWIRGGSVQHHLIDPRTSRPAQTPWSQVTACGASCLAADIAAKAGFLLGERGPTWLDRKGIPARFLTADDEVTVNAAWRLGVGEAAPCI